MSEYSYNYHCYCQSHFPLASPLPPDHPPKLYDQGTHFVDEFSKRQNGGRNLRMTFCKGGDLNLRHLQTEQTEDVYILHNTGPLTFWSSLAVQLSV